MSYEDDRAAYSRMRDRGLHPDRIDGCAELEATATRDTLGWGRYFTPDELEEAKEAMSAALEAGGMP